jgi:serine/threonine protein kinase
VSAFELKHTIRTAKGNVFQSFITQEQYEEATTFFASNPKESFMRLSEIPHKVLFSHDNDAMYLLLSRKYSQAVLGTGNFAVVKLGQNLATGEIVAIKRPTKRTYERTVSDFVYGYQSEFQALNQVKRTKSNSVLFGKSVTKRFLSIPNSNTLALDIKKPYLVMKHVKGMTVHDWIVSGEKFENDYGVMYYAIFLALVEIHKSGYTHGDPHMQNALIVWENNELKVEFIDFGASYPVDEDYTPACDILNGLISFLFTIGRFHPEFLNSSLARSWSRDIPQEYAKLSEKERESIWAFNSLNKL